MEGSRWTLSSLLVTLLCISLAYLLREARGDTEVPHVPWPADAAAVVAGRRPVVLKDSPVAQWAALARWDPDHFAANGPEVLKLVWHAPSPCLVYTSDRGELGGTTRMRGCDATAGPPVARAMQPAEFFATAARGVEPGVLYWQDELSSLGPRLAAEVDAAPLGVHEVAGGEVAQLAWIGTRGATTQAHYDIEHNFFAQLYGTKRFVYASAHVELRSPLTTAQADQRGHLWNGPPPRPLTRRRVGAGCGRPPRTPRCGCTPRATRATGRASSQACPTPPTWTPHCRVRRTGPVWPRSLGLWQGGAEPAAATPSGPVCSLAPCACSAQARGAPSSSRPASCCTCLPSGCTTSPPPPTSPCRAP